MGLSLFIIIPTVAPAVVAHGQVLDAGPVEHRPGEPLPPITPGLIVVGAITLVAFVLFATELFPLDITAIGIMISLIIFEPWTGMGPAEGIAGFSSTATITVLCMFIIGEGIRRTSWSTAWATRLSDSSAMV